MVLTPMTQQRTVEESAECFLRVAVTVRAWVGNRRSGRQCLNAFRYEKERWRFHQSANSYELERDPRGTDACSSPTFSHCEREGEEDRRRAGWRKPVSPGGRFGVSGREDFLGKGEREDSRKTSHERQRQKDTSRVEKG
ncbi:hypothetical protein ALC57_09513 [Trachymyrmex cornetzi]|uniref:Uncharacterized protein n=1 Tax=Trachymyrmex cornetzi TaxID=471704 RepID=A0A195DZ71_9HYME|nr:hypothetical protein ALC57_09513 [Trachymyrmex cornetzi]